MLVNEAFFLGKPRAAHTPGNLPYPLKANAKIVKDPGKYFKLRVAKGVIYDGIDPLMIDDRSL